MCRKEEKSVCVVCEKEPLSLICFGLVVPTVLFVSVSVFLWKQKNQIKSILHRSFIRSIQLNSFPSVFLFFFPSKIKNRNFALNVEPHPEISPPESWSLYPEGSLLVFFPLGFLLLWFIARGKEMATSIGIMDSAYFVGRNEILSWINNRLQLNLSRIEEVTLLVLAIIQWKKKTFHFLFCFLLLVEKWGFFLPLVSVFDVIFWMPVVFFLFI